MSVHSGAAAAAERVCCAAICYSVITIGLHNGVMIELITGPRCLRCCKRFARAF